MKSTAKKKAYLRKWYAANRKRMITKATVWHKEHPDRSREIHRKHVAKRLKTNPNYKMRHYLSCRINRVLGGRRKTDCTTKLLGCSVEDFWIYLESKFEPGMTRENYGKVWHVDHIMPCSIFDLSKPEHQKRCFHFSNLQPLFVKDNLKKSNSVSSSQFELI